MEIILLLWRRVSAIVVWLIKKFLLLWWIFSATFVWSMEIILLLWKRVSAITVRLMEIILLLWRRVAGIIAWLIKIILLLWKTFSGIFCKINEKLFCCFEGGFQLLLHDWWKLFLLKTIKKTMTMHHKLSYKVREF